MLPRLSPQARDRNRELAMALGQTFNAPSWMRSAITQVTLGAPKDQADEAVNAIAKAAEAALRQIGNSARIARREAPTATDAQADATAKIRNPMLATERASGARYQSLRAELSAEHLGKLIKKGSRGIVRDASQQFTGEDGVLIRSAAAHAAALEASRQPFITAIDALWLRRTTRKEMPQRRRDVRYTVLLAMSTVVLYAAVIFGLMLFCVNHLLAPDSAAP